MHSQLMVNMAVCPVYLSSCIETAELLKCSDALLDLAAFHDEIARCFRLILFVLPLAFLASCFVLLL